ncbi:ABC transporter substrate-binding protein [Vulgatibacter incomptus]|uniref:Branched-chain amino acid ABC transporter, amino acid-binding protein n=1 Tax=Vulgatibacter incomptus TaxID=1391653 RepID=A0A0K1PHS9_9BACT|nr:ABC transporter substrate-binding protein [Vulgatibacter incomptus]AKU93080.1 Branched-chain amino acid ABC transporter, amino acid-binding protein [Vulgatibacter incomptus]
MQGSRPLIRVAVLAASVFALLTGCKAKEQGTPEGAAKASGSSPSGEFLIGEVSSLTGQEATFGTSTHNGVLLAVQEINEAGGINGKKIRVITYDDQGKPTEAAAAATRLIVQDKVHLLFGEVASARSLAMAPIAQGKKVPMLTHASTNPKVTEDKDYVFRTCFIDPFQGAVMARFARDTLKASKVAVLRDVRNDYSVGLANFFVEAFEKSGGQILVDQSFSAGDIDFKAQLTAIRATNPEAIYVPGYYTDVGLIARQARELGITVPLLGGDGWDSGKLTEIAGDALDGSYFSNHYSLDNPDPRIQKFLKTYQAKFGMVSDAMSALAYEAIYLAADAARRASSTEGAALRDALAATKDFPGITGTITIDSERNAMKPAVIVAIKGQKWVYAGTVTP